MSRLNKLIDELENKIPEYEILNLKVSNAAVGWHIQHSLLTLSTITGALKTSDPKKYKYKFSLIKTLVYALNKFPRGKAMAPSVVVPKEKITPDSISAELKTLRNKLEELESLDKNSYFKHPIFGNLNIKPTRKFFILHTRHHLKIIDDILKDKSP